MPKYTSKAQLKRATDEEIEQFFSETVFEGIFSHEIKSSKSEYYKGCITDIKIEGRSCSLTPLFLNVPRTSKGVPEGPCAFKCRMNIPAFRGEPSKYIINLLGGTLTSISTLSSPSIEINSKDTRTSELFEMWGVDNCQCIGYYHYDEDNDVYLVDDLRKPNFDHIPYYPGDKERRPISIMYPNKIFGIKLNDYYLFTWKLSHRNAFNPYEIVLDFDTEQPKPIDPKWFIDTLFDDRHNDKSKNFGSATNFLDTLSKQLSAKESTFIYELLQNANDYPVEGKLVDVEFYITDNYLLFLHSGEKFNVRNISGICGINEKEKTANKKTIGYKGIGFKTVFLNNHYVYLRTGKYSFRFDEGEMPEKKMGGKIRRLEAPFQILPIWTTHEEVASEVNEVFDNSDKKYQVQIALRPEDKNILHGGRNSYESLFREVFSDSNIILFIPNINSVRVIINGIEERTCYRNNEEWVVGDYEDEINAELQELINKTIDKGNSRIPEKYKDFEYTKVSFACKHEGAIIKPVDEATLYCYLPTRASWGLPFLLNTDMIPKGDRNDIETEVRLLDEDETNFNEKLAEIAGNKLFWWIRDLLTSRKYHLGSVFSLIPDFKRCTKEHREYSEFITSFETSFEECLSVETIVPVPQGISVVGSVILDTTGLSTSGIMSDDEFRKFSKMEDFYLPLPMLRKDKNFISFLRRYADDNQKFEKSDIFKLIKNIDFQGWLKNQENNNKFLEFLLEADYIKDFFNSEIFLEAEGNLFSASKLFYDVDAYLADLHSFEKYIYYLSPKTREFFKDNPKWNEIIDERFATFDCDSFVNGVLLSKENIEDTKKILKDKDTSIHFFKFLAENVVFDQSFEDLPFINDSDEVVDDFSDKFIFLSSEEGHKVVASKWISPVDIEFISNDYTEQTKKYFVDYINVLHFSDEIIVKRIILSDEFKSSIFEEIEDIETSKDFLQYCFSNKSLFKTCELRDCSLMVYDGEGNEQWYTADGDVFFPSSRYDYYSAKAWIKPSWMVVLSNDYSFDNSAELKRFLADVFGVAELTENTFYTNIVKPNVNEIIKLVSGKEDSDGTKNIDFIKYLDENYTMIFEECHDSELFRNYIPVSTDICDLSVDDNKYVFDEDLLEIIDNDWFPEDVVYLCNKEYGKSRALQAIGCKLYDFPSFFNDVIVKELAAINDNIDNIEKSIKFHNFIISHLRGLTTEQQEKMIGAKVFLYGGNVVTKASGHKILSVKAKELFDKKLVEFSDLDIIDPAYKTEDNTEYWETRLGNTKFTVAHFFGWLKDNSETFSDTIHDESLNVEFWRWLKNNVNITDKLKEEIPALPILIKGGGVVSNQSAVYFSDEYLEGKTIETYVKSFNGDALFLSPKYISENDNLDSWMLFWQKLGVKHEIIDVIIETIIPKLANIKDDTLLCLLSENRQKLEEHFNNNLISHLSNLFLKGRDGYYSIKNIVYVDCEKEEPFPYIELPNQITCSNAGERRLVKDLMEKYGGSCISTLSEWQQFKVDYYLKMQDKDNDSVRDIHFAFINDLSIIRNDNADTLKEIERIKDINLLNRNNIFCKASTLTMGSVYKPFFDFEQCEIDTLDYVSNEYNEKSSEYTGRLFRALGIHCDFKRKDVDFLRQRICAVYFWRTYLTKKDANILEVVDIIENHLLDNIPCIPTKDYMKSPQELYYGTGVERYIKSIEDWENKIPLMTIPEIKLPDNTSLFCKLPFKDTLGFLDALYALINISGQERRIQLLYWMIDDYSEDYNDKIQEYRNDEHALWYNTKNESVQISSLYALDYWDKSLEQYFGSNNPYIINKNYLPAGDSFKKACDILGVQTICSEDLIMVPEKDLVFSQRNNDLRLFALVIAGKIDSSDWKNLYASYCKKLDNLILHRCESIKITYKEDESINQTLKKFYHEKTSDDFFFVHSLDDKRVFQYFVKEYLEYIGVKEGQISIELVEDIIDSPQNALEVAKEDNTLMVDNDFRSQLESLVPETRGRLSGNEITDEDEHDESYRPSFTTKQMQEEKADFGQDFNYNESESLPLNSDDGSTKTIPDVHEQKDRYPIADTTDSSNEENIKSGKLGVKSNETIENTRTEESLREQKDFDIPNEKSLDEEHISDDSLKDIQIPDEYIYDSDDVLIEPDPDLGDFMGSVEKDDDYEPIGISPHKPRKRRIPKPFTKEEINRLRSNGVPLELESLLETKEEIDVLSQCGITPDQIADTNYLAQLRLYRNLIDRGEEPEETLEEFVKNADDVTTHALRSGKYIHACSAARGVMYISPSVWNKMLDDKWIICVYLDGKGKNFHYINSSEEFLELVKKDDVVVKITGKEKVEVVKDLYKGVLKGAKCTAYTLIRVASRTNMDAVFAHYVGGMAEPEDGNDNNDYGN